MFECTLRRADPSQPWGFRLTGGLEFNEPIVVQRVTPGSVASDYVQPDDVIVAINNQDVTNVSHSVAMETIKMATNSLHLVLNRSDNSTENLEQSNFYSKSPEANFYQCNPPPLGVLPKYTAPNTPVMSSVPSVPPDPVLNMAARGDPGGRKPFAYVADVADIQQQREKVKRNRAQVSIPHYQNALNLPNFNDPPARVAVPDVPPGAVVQNLQFNSPLQMYSTDNVVDALKCQAGGDISGVVGLKQKDKSDFTQSAVYKMVHGLDQPKARPIIAYAEYKTDNLYRDVAPEIDRNSINFNNADIQEDGQLNERALRYKGNSIPSKSFRLLQNMTEGDVPMPLPHGKPIITPEEEDQKHQMRRRGPNLHRINLRQEPTPETQEQYPSNHQQRDNAPRHDDESAWGAGGGGCGGEPPLQHLRYVGNSIPCKSFRFLQNIVGENNDDSDSQSTPSHLSGPQYQMRQMKVRKAVPVKEIEATDF